MYAIVDIKSKQFKVREGDELYVPYQSELDPGDTVTYQDVLLLSDDGSVDIGQPLVDGASIEATVLDHVKGDKVTVFKMKRRNRYRVKRGHRQPYTQIQVDKIVGGGTESAEESEEEVETEAA